MICTFPVIGLLLLIAFLQLTTAPIAAHLVVRAGYRRSIAGDRSEIDAEGEPHAGS